MILMEHEWSVRDVCFLFCLDYPEVIFFSSVRFTLVPPPSAPQTLVFPLFNYRPHERTRELQELGVNRRVARGGFAPTYAGAIYPRRPRDWRAQEGDPYFFGGKVVQIERLSGAR